jgi:HTH-type transcriptional regulator/antitoxin HigA
VPYGNGVLQRAGTHHVALNGGGSDRAHEDRHNSADYVRDDYEAALAEIKRLWSVEAGSPEAQKIEVLAMLAQSFERAREPLAKPNPIEAIKFRMDQQGLTRKDLLPIFGTTARISEILSGKRSLTLEMVQKLHYRLGIPLESLVVPERRRARRTTRRKLQGKRNGQHRAA